MIYYALFRNRRGKMFLTLGCVLLGMFILAQAADGQIIQTWKVQQTPDMADNDMDDSADSSLAAVRCPPGERPQDALMAAGAYWNNYRGRITTGSFFLDQIYFIKYFIKYLNFSLNPTKLESVTQSLNKRKPLILKELC